MLLQFGITIYRIFWRRLRGYPKRLTGPRTQVKILATFTTERAKRVAGVVDAVASACGTNHYSGFARIDVIKLAHGKKNMQWALQIRCVLKSKRLVQKPHPRHRSEVCHHFHGASAGLTPSGDFR